MYQQPMQLECWKWSSGEPLIYPTDRNSFEVSGCRVYYDPTESIPLYVYQTRWAVIPARYGQIHVSTRQDSVWQQPVIALGPLTSNKSKNDSSKNLVLILRKY